MLIRDVVTNTAGIVQYATTDIKITLSDMIQQSPIQWEAKANHCY